MSLWKQNRSKDKVISINQLFKVLSTGTNTCPQPWQPLINGLVDDALLKLSLDRNWPLLILQGSVATLFRWSWKILSYFVANLSKTLRINFYQNRSSIVEVMIKKFWCVFYASQCTVDAAATPSLRHWLSVRIHVLCTILSPKYELHRVIWSGCSTN